MVQNRETHDEIVRVDRSGELHANSTRWTSFVCHFSCDAGFKDRKEDCHLVGSVHARYTLSLPMLYDVATPAVVAAQNHAYYPAMAESANCL